jgi:acetyl-CoA synthetase (ADP-forming)
MKTSKENVKVMLPHEALNLCKKYDIPVADYAFAATCDQAVRIAENIGFPVVLKIVSTDVIHKSDIGGVALGLQTPEEVVEAFESIRQNLSTYSPSARMLGVLVQRMVQRGVEVIAGAARDPQFGPIIMFGLGGIFVEALDDVSFRIAPIDIADASEMIEEIKGYIVLKGVRGGSPSDIKAIAEVLVKLSNLIIKEEEVLEVDLNPVVVYPEGAVVVDARVILAGK